MPSPSQQNKKGAGINLGWDDAFKDTYLNDIMKHEIRTPDKNPFAFNN